MRCTGSLLLLLMLAGGCQQEAPFDGRPVEPASRDATSATGIPVRIETVPERPAAGEQTHLSLRIGMPTDSLPRLEPIANSPVHLVAVNRDLTWYEHLHPRADGDRYEAMVRFPADGEYVLHAIVRPRDRGQRVEKRIVQVGRDRADSTWRPLRTSPRETSSGRYTVRLRANPDPPAVGVWNSLTFHISRDERPVTNLTPTGTLGHMVIFREGGEDFVYAHSTDGEAKGGVRARAHQPAVPPSLDTSHARHVGDTGPEVTFHTQFPRGGKYKAWLELYAGDEAIRADFVVEVSEQRPQVSHNH